MTAFEGFLFSHGLKDKLTRIADEKISGWQHLYIALQGGVKEYLYATDDAIYIIKKGYMTGHTFGDGVYRIPYQNITNVSVEYHFLSGYLEVSTNGMQAEAKSYWSTDRKTDPKKAPNCITILNKKDAQGFQKAADKILKMAAEVQSTNYNASPAIETDYTDELIKLKDLVDAGVITQNEFNAKKKQILGL